jgi:hypothetical protein
VCLACARGKMGKLKFPCYLVKHGQPLFFFFFFFQRLAKSLSARQAQYDSQGGNGGGEWAER